MMSLERTVRLCVFRILCTPFTPFQNWMCLRSTTRKIIPHRFAKWLGSMATDLRANGQQTNSYQKWLKRKSSCLFWGKDRRSCFPGDVSFNQPIDSLPDPLSHSLLACAFLSPCGQFLVVLESMYRIWLNKSRENTCKRVSKTNRIVIIFSDLSLIHGHHNLFTVITCWRIPGSSRGSEHHQLLQNPHRAWRPQLSALPLVLGEAFLNGLPELAMENQR